MIKHIENLSTEDKLFMVTNKKCFSNSSKTSINFNFEEWMTMIENTVPPEKIEVMEKLPMTAKNKMLTILVNVGKPEMIKKFVDSLCDDIIMERNQDIIEFLNFSYTHIKNITKKCKLKPEEIGLIYKALYTVYIPWKITANTIKRKTSVDFKPEDGHLFDYSNNINKILFKEIATVREPSASAVLIHYLMNNLGIDIKASKCVDFLIDGTRYYNHEDDSSIN